MKYLFLFLSCAMGFTVSAQTELYSRAYGDSLKPAVIFLHGGPGYNAVSFEHSTVQRLADEAQCYVIVYDQRGCGRSKADHKAKFTFREAFADLDGIYKKYNIEKATLIGHSFGGTVGVLFADKYPKRVRSLVWVGSPLSYQTTFRHIISRCRELYTEQGKTEQLAYLDMLEKMDTASLAYSGSCFMHAMQAGFYAPKERTDEAKALYAALKKSSDAGYLSQMTTEPVTGFYENEKYTTFHLATPLKKAAEKVPVYGIYGTEDGLFDEIHLSMLRKLIPAERFWVIAGASHSVFLDQQTLFVQKMKGIVATPAPPSK